MLSGTRAFIFPIVERLNQITEEREKGTEAARLHRPIKFLLATDCSAVRANVYVHCKYSPEREREREVLSARVLVKEGRVRGGGGGGRALQFCDSSRIITWNPEIPVVDLRSREESSSHVFPASRGARLRTSLKMEAAAQVGEAASLRASGTRRLEAG